MTGRSGQRHPAGIIFSLKGSIKQALKVNVYSDTFEKLLMMNAEQFRSYCLSKKGATESLPFNEYVLVFKVMGKMFALIDLSEPDSINLKCDPEYAVELREKHPDIMPG